VPSDVKKAYNSLAGYSYSYVSMYTQLIKAMFAAAVADRILLSSPCLSIKPLKAEAGTHRAIEEGERRLILQSGHRFTPAVMVMLYAGLRRGEVLALNVDRDVDFNAMTITVREAVRFDNNAPIISDPKTEAGKRTIPLLDVLAAVLRPIHCLVAPSSTGGLMSETSVKKAWSSYLVHLRTLGADQPVRIRMHDLRHSFCTMLYDAGIDIKTAMKWMGHADQTMTLRIYTHLTAEKEAAAANKLRHAVNDHLASGMQNGMQTQPDDAVNNAV
jgi:integrase